VSEFLTKYYAGDQIDKNEIGRAHSTYGGREEVHTGLLWGNLRKRDHLEEPGVDGRILKMDLQEVIWGAWTGLIWLRIGTGGGLI
jgi:hypothetical protein